jgi:hypothetical protein
VLIKRSIRHIREQPFVPLIRHRLIPAKAITVPGDGSFSWLPEKPTHR